MKYDEVLGLLQSNSNLDIVRRMQMIGLDPFSAFAGGDWRNCNFSNLNLQKFDMRHADFRGAIFVGADVNHADFRHSSIDEGLSVARNFRSIAIDYDKKLEIDRIRGNLFIPIANIYEKDNFIEKDVFDKVTKDCAIEFERVREETFSKYGIDYEKIKLTDFIMLGVLGYLNKNFRAKEARTFSIQLLKLFRKYKGSTRVNSIALIEACKYIKYSQFLEFIWPVLKNSKKFYDYSPASYKISNLPDDEKSRLAFEICRSKHEPIKYARYSDIIKI